MNIYDKKQVKCSVCGKFIGEIDIKSSIRLPLCEKCNRNEKKIIRKGIDSILVPVDISEKSTRALDAAIYFAKQLGSKITLLYVIPDLKVGNRIFMKEIAKELQKTSKISLKYAKDYCDERNIVAKQMTVRGHEPEEIIKISKKSKYDMIIMGSSGKGMLKELIFGSVSNFVMQNSDIPVLIVKEKSAKIGTKTRLKQRKPNPRHGEGRSFSKMKEKAGLK
ncbi:UspA domain-containing protein [Candidatus Nitrosopumilus koreensis AR1]|uniref:UspA domain-containing protein n=1 Tax=Candidatus Nitrosopumilus koreensis AR1 TaxID=1229908 RepID=K0B7G2_9ARCH|nr:MULTISPECIES: universal stress protein [Nitrosopumilus]AFS81107.1 UspA domain-containing protein [Candidatus Nitrosopumilus koreensis AR1]